MKKKIKKIAIFLVITCILAGSAVGGVYAYQNYRMDNLTAKVITVDSINYGYYDEGESTAGEGRIVNDFSQTIYTEDKVIKEVFVAQGDSVDVGTPLLAYDTTQEELKVDMKKLDIQKIDNDVLLAKRELEHLKTVKPVPDDAPEASGESQTTTTTTTTNEKKPVILDVVMQEKVGDAYNYIDKSSKPYTGDGTPEEPYRFLCTQECYVMGSYLNRLVEKEEAAAFEIWSGNSREDGNLVSCWTVDGSDMTAVEADSKWSVVTQEIVQEEVYDEPEEMDEPEGPDEPEDDSTEVIYTVSELNEAILENETKIKEYDIKKRQEELELKKLERDVEKGKVVSNIKGIVKTLGDPENPSDDGSPFMEIVDSKGIYVKGEIGELLLDKAKVGQTIYISSYNTGQTYEAVIKEISDYPVDETISWHEGNTNVSYYEFTAYIDNPEGLTPDDYVNISMNPVNQEDIYSSNMDVIVLSKAFVRTENGKSYVLKAGKDDRLVKQYVKTGKISYGGIVIEEGLEGSDRIAFPYGKTAKEGIKVVDGDVEEFY